MFFPQLRLRRLRKNETIRRMIRETRLSVDQFIYPLFVCPGKGVKNPVRSMPGVFQMSTDEILKEAAEVSALNIPAVILFGLPESKDPLATGAYAPDGIIQQAIPPLKEKFPDLMVITDLCLCEYTSHGHCGVLKGETVDNDATLELLTQTAISHALAGADMVAPSDMMDGRIQAIRNGLDEEGFSHLPILAYAAKYASAFYGPFREAAESAPQFGDRKSYQMDPPNRLEALREIELDLSEGAYIVMVKPALAYLDIISQAKEIFGVPLAAYNVSGEYAMVKAASQLGWVDGEQVMMEILLAIVRAGADLILTYHAKEAAGILQR